MLARQQQPAVVWLGITESDKAIADRVMTSDLPVSRKTCGWVVPMVSSRYLFLGSAVTSVKSPYHIGLTAAEIERKIEEQKKKTQRLK